MEKGRIFQDRSFEYTTCNGEQLQQCIVCVDPIENYVIMVYVQTATGFWFQFFLDACIGFLECYGAPENEEGWRYVDMTDDFKLRGEIIKRLYCEPHGRNSRIVMEFNRPEQLVLQTTEPEVILSISELLLLPVDKY